jgi:site-specific DNA-cytosine methylase
MENVLDILKKEDGLYAKFAAATLVNLRYQTRTGLVCSAYYGVPQVRWR